MHTTNPTLTSGSGSAGGPRRRLAARTATALAAVTVSVVSLGLASVPAMADDCPNAALRAQNNSTQLPDCRAYELVSPLFKEGFPPALAGFTDDDRVTYLSNGNYANNGNGGPGFAVGGNAYMAVRSASGWLTTALAPRGPDYYEKSSIPTAFSSDLSSSLWVMRRGDEPDAVSDVYVRGPDEVFTRMGSAGASFVASDDLSHVAFSGTDNAHAGNVYEYVGTGGDQPRLVSVDNAGQEITPAGCETAPGSRLSSFYHAISTDGRVIFWTSSCLSGVYARVNGMTTINASASQCMRAPSDPGGVCGADSTATFEGANADGTRVYFTTDQQLVNADTDSTTDLYECVIPTGTPAPVGAANPCPDLREVSGTASGAHVQGVTRISDDGSRVYFVATGVLASNPAANGATAMDGDDNLYVWHRDAAHPSGEMTFVGKLDPGDNGSMWGSETTAGRLAQSTDDGRYLVFVTYASLVDHGPQADTDTARDIYRYDAETGALTRLSTGVDGDGGNDPGHNAQFTGITYSPVTPTTYRPRGAMTDDGESVVFTTDEGLTPDDTNGTLDSYLWRDGRVSLISSGKPSADGGLPAGGDPGVGGILTGVQASITPSGRDVYFTTTAQLTTNDVDQQIDLYDARIDGGFDVAPPAGCVGDACQGGGSAPPLPSQSGSASSVGQDGPAQVTPSFSVKSLTAVQRKRVASTGTVSLSVTTNAPGALSAKATATIAKRSSTVGSAKRTVAAAGTVVLSLTLSEKAQAELKSRGKLTVKVRVGQDNVAIARTLSLKLTRPKAAEKKANKKTLRHAVVKGGRS